MSNNKHSSPPAVKIEVRRSTRLEVPKVEVEINSINASGSETDGKYSEKGSMDLPGMLQVGSKFENSDEDDSILNANGSAKRKNSLIKHIDSAEHSRFSNSIKQLLAVRPENINAAASTSKVIRRFSTDSSLIEFLNKLEPPLEKYRTLANYLETFTAVGIDSIADLKFLSTQDDIQMEEVRKILVAEGLPYVKSLKFVN